MRPSAQHEGAAVPGVHVDDSVSVHTAATHDPPWHTRPEQQSALVEHDPVLTQQRPLWQSVDPQHPSDDAQAAPGAPQQRVVPTTSAHDRPPAQHEGADAPAVHVTDSARLHASAWQVPD